MKNKRRLWWKYGYVRPLYRYCLLWTLGTPLQEGFHSFDEEIFFKFLSLLLIAVCFFVCLLVMCRNLMQKIET